MYQDSLKGKCWLAWLHAREWITKKISRKSFVDIQCDTYSHCFMWDMRKLLKCPLRVCATNYIRDIYLSSFNVIMEAGVQFLHGQSRTLSTPWEIFFMENNHTQVRKAPKEAYISTQTPLPLFHASLCYWARGKWAPGVLYMYTGSLVGRKLTTQACKWLIARPPSPRGTRYLNEPHRFVLSFYNNLLQCCLLYV